MDVSLVDFAQLSDDDIKRLAVLHHSAMHTLLSELGLPVVLRYYQLAKVEPEVLGMCAVSTSGEILGWAMGSPYPDRINAGLRSPLSWFLAQMFRLMLTRPLVLWQLISTVLSSSSQVEMTSGAIELTYIGVAANQRRRGMGAKLLNAFIEASRAHGYRSVILSVEKENSSALVLYERAGFKVIRTFTEGRFARHRMELTLV